MVCSPARRRRVGFLATVCCPIFVKSGGAGRAASSRSLQMEGVVCDESSVTRLPPFEAGGHSGGESGDSGPRYDAGKRGEEDKYGCPKFSERQGAGGQPENGISEYGWREDGAVQDAAGSGDDTAQQNIEDRIKNKCLIGNWQEQRIVAPLDQHEEKTMSHAIAFKNGHKGLLTTDYLSKISDITTYQESYPPKGIRERQKGIKKQLIEKYLNHKICKEVFDEHNAIFAIAPMESLSVTGRDFRMEGFKSVPSPPTMNHNYKTEQPITIWSDHVKQVHGVTAIKTGDTPFRKHTSFTKPIMETLDS
ncbi:sperm associated antigen 8 [Heptranchias perlo]|uniref:sperm associated antigen 8 n=1 Tax=Heptranchias perlo TaxID=212740 RepID=UPI00355A929C